jgi:hypothetical protein
MTLGGSKRDPIATPTIDRPLIVHSHLRWDFVWQRPQQILSRLARHAPVLFVEEPIFEDERMMAHLELTEPSPNVTRAVPHLPVALRDQYDRGEEMVRSLLLAATGPGGTLEQRFDAPVQWFYTPMPVPTMLGSFSEVGVVYDCMDELAQFRFAPTEMRDRELQLLHEADVVFTGGRRLYDSKSRHHPNVHFFGCGVDADHFGRARETATPVERAIAELSQQGTRKVAGYFGVIDERLDYELIGMLADARPDVAIAMVGPIVKVDPRELPQRENLAWLGARQYADLPSCVKGFDVCLMPFALNEATEYINPTKTLEYMAAGRPIVSTAVPDVQRNFTPIVQVAPTREAFVLAVGKALAAPDRARIAAGLERARGSTWESITQAMRRLILDAVMTNSHADEELTGARSRTARAETRARTVSRGWAHAPVDAASDAAGGEISA